MRHRVLACVAVFALTSAIFLNDEVFKMSGTSYVSTKEPLLRSSNGDERRYYMLPTGTALYKDRDFPEGFTRYRVYINIKSEFAQTKIQSEKTNLVDPIWAYTIPAEELPGLMAQVPVGKDDLLRILKARQVTRDDLAKIVREWKD